jgi:hypothetical protein
MIIPVLPLVEIFGPTEIAGFFQNVYALMYPAMPFLMIGAATALAGILITVLRRVFSFNTLISDEEEDYNKKDYNRD